MPDPSPDDVLRLARAVSMPSAGALLIDSNNHSIGGQVPLERAVASGCAFMVRMRPDLVGLDDDGIGWTDRVVEVLVAQGCAVRVRVRSGPDAGHLHTIVQVPVWLTAEEVASLAREAGAPGQGVRHGHGNRLRPPLSPHRSGGRSVLLDPPTAEDALQALAEPRPGFAPLKPKWPAALAGPKPDDRNTTLWRVALAYVNAGLGFQDFRAACWASAWCSDYLRTKKPSYLAETKWEPATRRVRESPLDSVERDRDLAALEHLVAAGDWRWRGGDTDRKVFRFLLGIALDWHTLEVNASQRLIAQEIGVRHATVNTSIKRLVARRRLRKVERRPEDAVSAEELIARIERGDGPPPVPAARYRLLVESAATRTSSAHSGPCMGSSGTADPHFEHHSPLPDAFRVRLGERGLPAAAFDTWRAVVSFGGCWAKTTDIVDRRGSMSPATVRRHLLALQSAGLAERSGLHGHSWRGIDKTAEELDCLAERFGTAGAAELQAARHAADRDHFDEYIRRRAHTPHARPPEAPMAA